ncbi:hypothetical protein ACP4OV_021130 [Aristida adscensionis]
MREIKALRLLENWEHFDGHGPVQLCEIVTLSNGSNHAQWRGMKASSEPPFVCSPNSSVVIDGIVYVFSYRPECIASFDLQAEEWRQPLRGPLSSLWDDDPQAWRGKFRLYELSLAALSGHLVVVYPTRASTDLWFLMDFEKSLWVKQHSIPKTVLPAKYSLSTLFVCPLVVLEDGRIMLYYRTISDGLVGTYSPRTNTFTDMAEVENCVAVGLYTGSLMSLATHAT